MAKDFIHLHVHTQYSINNGLGRIRDYVDKAINDGMPGMAVTDFGNMFGIKEFHDYVKGVNKKREKNGEEPFKPIFGCEMCVEPDYHIILLAKNHHGYENLVRLVSYSFLFEHDEFPYTKRSLLREYHDGIIVLSGGLSGEVSSKLLNKNISGACESIEWYRSIFGDDFYLELQRNEVKDESIIANREIYRKQVKINDLLLGLAREYGIKVVCTNNVHFAEPEHAEVHATQLCIANNMDLDNNDRLRYSKQEWFKNYDEMSSIFKDVPEALSNTIEILNKVEIYSLDRAPRLPLFIVPRDNEEVKTKEGDGLIGEYDFLERLSFSGAYQIYGEPLPSNVVERLNYELRIIKNMDCVRYFLIIEDIISVLCKKYKMVAQGRGAVTGSLVAYCLGITKIDPMKHDLLFERFVNQNRKVLPIIPIDLEKGSKSLVKKHLEDKYGKEECANIVAFEKMDTKNSIMEVARVEELPSRIASFLCSSIPYRLPNDMRTNLVNAAKCIPEIQEAESSTAPPLANTIKYAKMIEGTISGVGIHSSGMIVSPNPIHFDVPIFTIEDPDKKGHAIVCTQYDEHFVDDTGLVRFDFYELRALNEIKETLIIDYGKIPLNDSMTIELLQEGNVFGVFGFDSIEMGINLYKLHPTSFEDLVALYVLVLPGIESSLLSFIKRKNGREEIKYDIPCMERYLKETYGLLIYQEQLMNLSRLLANFTPDESDRLRKAMGKKKQETIDEMKPRFIEGGKKNGYDSKILEKIWKDWEAYGGYLCCKAHAVSYTWLAYQTAYLKAHYPEKYMSVLLKYRKDDKSELRELEKECERMGIKPY